MNISTSEFSLTWSSAVAIDKFRAEVTGGERVEECLLGAGRIDRDYRAQARSSLAKKTTNEVLCSLYDTRIQIGPRNEALAIVVQIGVS